MDSYVAELSELPVAQLERFFAKETTLPWEKSMMFDSKKEAKFVDESLRSSSFRTFETKEAFEAFDSIMQAVNDPKLNPIAATKTFTLFRSDVTEISYPVGGFFKKHKDFLSVTSNSITEFTLIVGLSSEGDSEVVGGETLIHSNGKTLSSSMTTTPGGGLLFRKDLEHEGDKLTAGSKRIATVNLWGIDKASTNDLSSGVLLITFADSSPPLPRPISKATSPPRRGSSRSSPRARPLNPSLSLFQPL